MSKMSELSQTLDDMIHVGENLIRVANEIKEIFSETKRVFTLKKSLGLRVLLSLIN